MHNSIVLAVALGNDHKHAVFNADATLPRLGEHRPDADHVDAAVVLVRFVGKRCRGGSHLFVGDHVSNYPFSCRGRPRPRIDHG
jgi:hypothetical protein